MRPYGINPPSIFLLFSSTLPFETIAEPMNRVHGQSFLTCWPSCWAWFAVYSVPDDAKRATFTAKIGKNTLVKQPIGSLFEITSDWLLP